MNRALLYYASQVVTGGAFVLFAASNVLSNGAGVSIPTALMIIGGAGMILGSGYHVLHSNYDRVELGTTTFWLAIAGAVLVLVAAVLSVAF